MTYNDVKRWFFNRFLNAHCLQRGNVHSQYHLKRIRNKNVQYSIWSSTTSYTSKLETDCKFCNQVRRRCVVCATLIGQAKWCHAARIHFVTPRTSESHYLKIVKSKYNLQFFHWTWIAEDILRFFSNKSGFQDKLKVCRQAGIVIYVIFACIILIQTHVLFIAVYSSDTV